MAIKWVGKNIECLSTDTKPTNVPTDTQAFETNTDDRFRFNGTAWVPLLTNLPGTAKYIVYFSGTTYRARNTITGVIDSASIALETVLQYCLNQGGSTYIVDGTHTFSASFAGLTFPVEPIYARITGGSNCHLVVPNGYTGYVFRFMNTSATNCSENILESVRIDEAGAVQKLWTGVLLQATSGVVGKGVSGNKIRDMGINYCRYGIYFLCDSTSTNNYCNTNYFDDIWINGAEVFINFDMQTPFLPSNGFHRNRFTNLTLQRTSTYTTHGVKDIRHKDNIFIGVYVVDFATPQITANIHADATGTVIIGGTMTGVDFTDASPTYETIIQDGIARTRFTRLTTGQLDLSPPADPANSIISVYNAARNHRLYIQRNATNGNYRIESTRTSTAGGSMYPLIFSMNDQGTVVESFRILSSGDIQLGDARNFALNATTGTKIGTATTQKLGFFNKAPVIQPTAISSPTADVTSLKTAVDAIRTALTALGLTG